MDKKYYAVRLKHNGIFLQSQLCGEEIVKNGVVFARPMVFDSIEVAKWMLKPLLNHLMENVEIIEVKSINPLEHGDWIVSDIV